MRRLQVGLVLDSLWMGLQNVAFGLGVLIGKHEDGSGERLWRS